MQSNMISVHKTKGKKWNKLVLHFLRLCVFVKLNFLFCFPLRTSVWIVRNWMRWYFMGSCALDNHHVCVCVVLVFFRGKLKSVPWTWFIWWMKLKFTILSQLNNPQRYIYILNAYMTMTHTHTCCVRAHWALCIAFTSFVRLSSIFDIKLTLPFFFSILIVAFKQKQYSMNREKKYKSRSESESESEPEWVKWNKNSSK